MDFAQVKAEILAAPNIEELFACLAHHIERLGFEYHTYELLRPIDQKPFFETNYPEDWKQHYIEEKFSADDIVILYMARTNLPFVWQSIIPALKLTKQQRRVFEEGRAAGIKAGATIPIYGHGPARAYLVVASNMTDAEFSRMFAAHEDALHVITLHAHARLLQLRPLTAIVGLSPRETEVMTLTARGNTCGEIAQRLKISTGVVEKHIKKVNAKLGVHNKAHATALLIQYSHILP